MKKTIPILILVLIVGCEKIEPSDLQPTEVREFLNSSDWIKYECLFEKYGTLGIGSVEYEMDSTKVQITLPYYRQDSTQTAMLQITKMDYGVLPNGDLYFINCVDLTRFDMKSKTGNVSMYGTNFDNFLHDEYLVIDNIIQVNYDYPLPDKYIEQLSTKKVGFFTCYKAMRDYWETIPVVKFLCDFDGLACFIAASFDCLMYLSN